MLVPQHVKPELSTCVYMPVAPACCVPLLPVVCAVLCVPPQAYLKQRSKAGQLAEVLLLIDASLPPKDIDLAGVQWLLGRKYPVTLVFTKCDKAKKGGPSPGDNIAGFRAAVESLKLLQPAQFPTCAVGAGSFGRQELLSYLARRVAAHTGAAQPAVFAAASRPGSCG